MRKKKSPKKGPKMAHPTAEEQLMREFDAIIDNAAENTDEAELLQREQQANAVVENVRARVSRRERA